MPSNGRGWLIGCGVVALFLVLAGGILIGFATLSGRTPTSLHRARVGVVEVFGVIGEDDDVLEQLDDFADDRSIEALVLHVNSPGGAVGTTQRIVARLQAMDSRSSPPSTMSRLRAATTSPPSPTRSSSCPARSPDRSGSS